MVIDDETLKNLEWDRVVSRLSSLCTTELGRKVPSRLQFHTSPPRVRDLLEEVRQMRLLIATDRAIDIRALPHVEEKVEKATAGGTLSGEAIVSVMQALSSSLCIRKYFQERKGKYPALSRKSRGIPDLLDFKKTLDEKIDEKGEVRDTASPSIGLLRKRAASARSRVFDTAKEIMASPRYRKHLQDNYVTVRNGRHVLPFKISSGGHLKGILHETSATKQTLFFEPEELVHAGNVLKTAEGELQEEVIRILRLVSMMIGEKGKDICKAASAAAQIDFIHAKALLADELKCGEPRVEAGGVITLIDCRHPLLLLGKKPAVPNSFKMGGEKRCMIVTGPNAGGKTVLIKTVGILTLMTMAGLSIPAHPDSLISPFKKIFLALGDLQSVEQDLSTFSADILKLKYFHDKASRDTLILLDEVITGTDPKEGSALGKAYLQALVSKGATLFVTTHFEEVKTLPMEDRRFIVASMGFSGKELSPTFRLSTGLPGRSMGIQIAEKIGFPRSVIDKARGYLGKREEKVQTLLEELARSKEEMERKGEIINRERSRLEREREQIREVGRKLKEQREDILQQARGKAASIAQRAEDEVEKVMKALRKERKVELVRKAKDVLRDIKVEAGKSPTSPDLQKKISETLPLSRGTELTSGQRIFVISLKRDGHVESVDMRKRKVKVSLGAVTSLIDLDDMRIYPETHPRERKKGALLSKNRKGELFLRMKENTLDVRGYEGEDALSEVDLFLDRAALKDFPNVCIIHGHGSGALKKRIREYLKNSPYVSSFSPAPREEGGDGATVVTLK